MGSVNLHPLIPFVFVTLSSCSLKDRLKAEDAGAAVPSADAGASASAVVAAVAPVPEEPTNKADLARFPAEKALDGASATVKTAKAVIQTSPGGGATVATLQAGDAVILVAEFKTFDRVLFASPKDPSKKLGGWLAKSAFDEPAKKSGIPTCPAGQLLGTEALSPFRPFCGAKCASDSDCRGVGCTNVNALKPDGTLVADESYIKLCDPDYKLTPTSAAPARAKCGAGEHFDDINKKCRAFGDCPKGYHWNDPMKSCLMDD